ncbi:hypothetical protein Poli38472_012746 [Pythium oligandrum]|uniref:RING-type domain-containing protein n=1 Tax=Pythium oligandrum TaxID=41045 RepID=A0A8K1CE71_PYTOL|nr:hypothetical protein Poli38472_012746 [Pythium oligandrum]|eukprot:TMW61555.1 hypothetical protein Poli38472_012746 [Pythium oligandrum]
MMAPMADDASPCVSPRETTTAASAPPASPSSAMPSPARTSANEPAEPTEEPPTLQEPDTSTPSTASTRRPSETPLQPPPLARTPPADVDVDAVFDPFFDRARLVVSTVVYVPQVLATMLVTPNLWKLDLTDARCSRDLIWVLIQAMFLALSIVDYWLWYWFVYWSQPSPGQTRQSNRHLTPRQRARGIILTKKIDTALYIFGLVWFAVGNVIVLIMDPESMCEIDHDKDQDKWGINDFAVVLLMLAYARVFWPCSIFLLVLPFAALCRPCLLSVIRSIGPENAYPIGVSAHHGASKETIETTTTRVKFTKGMVLSSTSVPSSLASTVHMAMEPNTCCICLMDYDIDDDLRVLPCGHEYHESCVDEWLMRNATCPVCRNSIEPTTTRAPTPAGRLEREFTTAEAIV